MKLWNVKTPRFRKRGYIAAGALSLCLLFCFGMVRAGAQLRAQKRITSVWTATGAEGSRVTVASEGQLNNYEAYTRGNRFYVKIPSVDLPATTGSLLGRGFDDVQIQRAGDGIILSFRLQPGTTARVDQKLNRLEVVFSIPMRSPSSGSGADRNEVANRTRARTIHDTVGPTPPFSATENQTGLRRHAERGERTTGSVGRSNSKPASEPHRSVAKSSASDSTRQKSLREKAIASSLPKASSSASAIQLRPSESPSPGNSSESKGSTTKGSTPSASPWPSASPIDSPSPVASPSSPSSLAAASPSGTPLYAAPATQQTSAGASPTPVSTGAGTTDWSSRLHYYKSWAQLNPVPLWIGGLTFLALLLLLFVMGRRKRRGVRTADREKRPAPATGPSAKPKPIMTDPAGAVSDQSRVQVPSENSISWPAVGKDAHAGEDPEREVFEL